MCSVRFLGDVTPDVLGRAGGKAATLARLFQAGFPVPNGFVILPAAFTPDDAVSPEVWESVRRALDRLRRAGAPVAVRSSAVGGRLAAGFFRWGG